jgi:hypothetical protein
MAAVAETVPSPVRLRVATAAWVRRPLAVPVSNRVGVVKAVMVITAEPPMVVTPTWRVRSPSEFLWLDPRPPSGKLRSASACLTTSGRDGDRHHPAVDHDGT